MGKVHLDAVAHGRNALGRSGLLYADAYRPRVIQEMGRVGRMIEVFTSFPLKSTDALLSAGVRIARNVRDGAWKEANGKIGQLALAMGVAYALAEFMDEVLGIDPKGGFGPFPLQVAYDLTHGSSVKEAVSILDPTSKPLPRAAGELLETVTGERTGRDFAMRNLAPSVLNRFDQFMNPGSPRSLVHWSANGKPYMMDSEGVRVGAPATVANRVKRVLGWMPSQYAEEQNQIRDWYNRVDEYQQEDQRLQNQIRLALQRRQVEEVGQAFRALVEHRKGDVQGAQSTLLEIMGSLGETRMDRQKDSVPKPLRLEFQMKQR